MRTVYIVANWKSYKTGKEAKQWMADVLHGLSNQLDGAGKKVIVCPSFPLLGDVSQLLRSATVPLPISLGAQTISSFDEGAYTGAVNGRQLQEFVSYVLIGHSERREHFSETNEVLGKQVAMAKKYLLTPIFCVRGIEDPIPAEVTLVAYEPVFAIGSGTPDTPKNASAMAALIKETYHVQTVLYGGSVTPENVASFTQAERIDGVLVGGASLSSSSFISIINHA